jgi:hypothetical protein
MKTVAVLLLVVLSAPSVVSLAAGQSRPCDGLTGPTHRRCLEREHQRAVAAARAAEKRLARLDRRMNATCDTVAILDNAARAASRAPDKTVRLAGSTYTLTRLLGKLTRERENCESARLAVEAQRRR